MDDKFSSGRYDDQCERLLNEQNAQMVVLLVIDGKKGHGLSICIHGDNPNALHMATLTPILLRKMADMIEHKGEFKLQNLPNQGSKSWSDMAKGDSEE